MRLDQQSGGYETAYKYTGKELDAETDLYYYGARYYDAKIGRFVSVDPWSGDLSDPQSFNKYSYVRNNPLKYTDPSGMVPDPTDTITIGCGPAAPACLALKEGAEMLVIYAAKEIAKVVVTELINTTNEEKTLTESVPETKEKSITNTSTPANTTPAPNTTTVPLDQSTTPNITTTPAWQPAEQSGCGINMSCADDKRSLPLQGQPDATELKWKDGRIEQGRTRDKNGNPSRDIDFSDNNKTAPNPHTHDWRQKPDGSYDHTSRSPEHKPLNK